MNFSSKKLIAFNLVLFFFLFFSSLNTHTVKAEGSDIYSSTTTNAECSDYYHFNGVTIDIKPAGIRAVTGTAMNFSGYISNTNEYPVISGRLYAKIFRVRSQNDGNGPDVLDSFVVKENIVLKAGQKMPIEFKWNIPAYALGGDYKLATYFISSDKFNLSGLSFTDDVVGGLSGFNVKAQQTTGVFFKKDGIKINNSPYFFAAFSSVQSATDPVEVLVPISNTTKIAQAVKVDFNIYKWDAQSVENKIETISQVAIIDPGKTINLPINIEDNKASVYYIETILNYRDSKSILGVRFVRDGVNMPRINFPSIVSYPLVSGHKNKIFACFHNASNSDVPVDGKLKLEILGDDGAPILSYEYNGKITGEMNAIVQDFIPKETYKDFKVHAMLFSGSKLVDETYISYVCSEIDPDHCGFFDFSEIVSNKWLMISLIILGVFIIAFIIFVIVRRRQGRAINLNPFKNWRFRKNSLKILIILAIFGAMFSPSLIQSVQAQSSSGSGSGTGEPWVSPPTGDSNSGTGGDIPTGGSNSGTDITTSTTTTTGSGSGVAGCFEISSVSPSPINICNDSKESCGWSSEPPLMLDVTGSKLDTVVQSILNKFYSVSIIEQGPSFMRLNLTKPQAWETGQLRGGSVPLWFRDSKACRTSYPFEITCEAPVITSIDPEEGTVGTILTITGYNL